MLANVSEPSVSRLPYLAAIQHPGNCGVDELLREVACRLKQAGYRVGGVIRAEEQRDGRHRCDMSLEELTSGQSVYISQQLGTGSQGCRLDTAALEKVVGMVDTTLENGNLDILFINKFGKREADGGGFNATIGQAVLAGVPVLVTLNQDFSSTWHQFCGGEGQILEASQDCVLEWLAQCLPKTCDDHGVFPKVQS